MKIKLLTSILCFFFLFAIKASGQHDPQIEWENTIGGSHNEIYSYVHQTMDGGYMVAGSSYSDSSGDKTQNSRGYWDCWIIKLDVFGNIQWDKTIGGVREDGATSIQQTIDKGFIVGGTSDSKISGDKTEDSIGLHDFWILKLDSLGNIQWQNTIGGDGEDYLVTTFQTHDGGYFVGGTTTSGVYGDKTEAGYGSDDIWILKLDTSGNITWQNSIGGNSLDDLNSAVQTSDGGFMLSGYSGSNISGDKTENSKGGADFWIIKTDSIGNPVWDKTIGGSGGDGYCTMRSTFDRGYILAGSSDSRISGDKTEDSIGEGDIWVVKVDSVGNIQWQNTIGGTSIDQLPNIIQVTDGGYMLEVESYSGISGDKTENNDATDIWILKLNSSGNIEWQNTIGGSNGDSPNSIEQTSDGGYIIGAWSQSDASRDKSENTTDSSGRPDFWILKLRDPTRSISGNIFADVNGNCILDSIADPHMHHKIVNDIISGGSVISQSDGSYQMLIFRDTTAIFVSNLTDRENVSCLANDTLTVFFTTPSFDTSNLNFPINGPTCAHLNIDINSFGRRPCDYQTYTLPYFNDGFDTARVAFIVVEIDLTTLDSFTSIYPFVQSGDSLIFPITNVAPYEYNTISFDAHIKCSTIIGSSTCTRAYIYPLSNCPLAYEGYDSSNIKLKSSCSGDTIFAQIINTGDNMISGGAIKAYENDVLISTNSFILNVGESINYEYIIHAEQTITIIAEQNAAHPTRPILITQDEHCALSFPIIYGSVINHFSRYDDAAAYEEICKQVVASFDPNLKSVVPEGLTSMHFVDTNQVFEYRIDFQNTGLDTAFKVTVIDTLSTDLDINTFVPLTASHPYKVKIAGTRILAFVFDPIELPDSNASEANSHGYVTFKIKPKAQTAPGTVIHNYADIYFDFNTPVRTNTIFNTILDTVLIHIGATNSSSQLFAFPNPATERFYLKSDKELVNARIILTDLSGKQVYELKDVNGSMVEMPISSLMQGMYLVNAYQKNKRIAFVKIVVY